jgi:hypothetical protein
VLVATIVICRCRRAFFAEDVFSRTRKQHYICGWPLSGPGLQFAARVLSVSSWNWGILATADCQHPMSQAQHRQRMQQQAQQQQGQGPASHEAVQAASGGQPGPGPGQPTASDSDHAASWQPGRWRLQRLQVLRTPDPAGAAVVVGGHHLVASVGLRWAAGGDDEDVQLLRLSC